jgi:hypothetical protein
MAEIFNMTDTWNDPGIQYRSIKMNIADIASAPGSLPLDLLVNSASVFSVDKNGGFTIKRSTGSSLGGMVVAGGAGEMALTSQIDPGSGAPAHVMRYYWENSQIGSAEGSAAVLRGMGTNRFSIESVAALVHIAGNGRFEWEGLGAERLHWVGYEAGSSIGKTIDFNNTGQAPTAANPVVSITVGEITSDTLHLCTWDPESEGYITNARFDGAGNLHVPSILVGSFVEVTSQPNVTSGLIVQATGEGWAKIFLGYDGSSNKPFLSFGPGDNARDSFFLRSAPGTFEARVFSSTGPFATVQAKLKTDTMAVTGTVTPDKYLILYDAAGTAYKVPCEAL